MGDHLRRPGARGEIPRADSASSVDDGTFRHVKDLVRSSYDSRHGGERFDHWQVSAINGPMQRSNLISRAASWPQLGASLNMMLGWLGCVPHD